MGSVTSLLVARLVTAKKALRMSSEAAAVRSPEFSDCFAAGSDSTLTKNVFLGSIYGDLDRSGSIVLGQSTLSVHSVAFKYQSSVTMDSLNNIRYVDDEDEGDENDAAVNEKHVPKDGEGPEDEDDGCHPEMVYSNILNGN